MRVPYVDVYERVVLDAQAGDLSNFVQRQIVKFSDHFSPTQIAVLLNSMAKQNLNNREILFSLTSRAVRNADQFQPFQLALVLNACTRLQFKSERLLETFAPLVQRHLASDAPINGQTCALLAGVLAKNFPGNKSLAALLRRVRRLLHDDRHLLNVADCAALLHCLSTEFAGERRREISELAWKLVQRVADEPTPAAVSVALLALGNFRGQVGLRSDNLLTLTNFVSTKINEFSVSQLGNVLAGLGLLTSAFRNEASLIYGAEVVEQIKHKLEHSPETAVPPSTIVQIFSACAKIPTDWSCVLSQLGRNLDFSTLNSQSVGVILNCLSLYNIRDVQPHISLVEQALLKDGQPQSVSLVLLSLARLEKYDDVLRISENLLGRGNMQKFSVQSLCNSLFALCPAVAFLEADVRPALVSQMAGILERLASMQSEIQKQANTQIAIAAGVLTDLEISQLSLPCLRWLRKVLASDDLCFKASPSELHADVRKFVHAPFLEEIGVGPYSVDIVLVDR